jgi:tetraacyldisaccharide 4'-kinase
VRGIAGTVERSWSGEPGTLPWTEALLPLAAGYGILSAAARARARATRRAIEGCHVVAVGNLTVGGTGKSAIARWLASEAAASGVRAAVLLRGHGAEAAPGARGVVPDFVGYPLEKAVARYGDEALAHRRSLPREVVVAVDPDRMRAGRAARSGYGARVLILDDGWEQGSLAWDELWVALDPRRPLGNGSLLPAGPLRRPKSAIREATRIVFVFEEPGEEIPDSTLQWLAREAPGIPRLSLRRALLGASPPGARERPAMPAPGARIALVSGIGAPARLTRFIRAAGLDLRYHAAFPDHARWSGSSLRAALSRGAREGAEAALITEKDEARWPSDLGGALPVRVIRTEIVPMDPADEALRAIRAR